jgi:putative phage-type endonuclease
MKVLTTELPGTPPWEAAHEGKLGAHDIASIVGVGRQTALQVWAKVTNHIPKEDLSGKSYIRRGIALEPVVAELYRKESRRIVRDSPGLIQHPTLDWIATTPDRVVEFGSENRAPLSGCVVQSGLLECKTAGFGHSKEWLAGIPLMVQVQLQMQLACCEMSMGSAACLPVDADDDAPDVLWADLPFDAVLVDRILDKLTDFRVKFWVTDIPPQATERDLGVIRKMFPAHAPGKVIPMTEQIETAWRTRERLTDEIKEEATKRGFKIKGFEDDPYKAEIVQALGDAEYAQGEHLLLRLRAEPRGEYWVPASSPRVLRSVKGVK